MEILGIIFRLLMGMFMLVTNREEIVDVNVSDDTVQLLRRDSFEVINARGKATRFEV